MEADHDKIGDVVIDSSRRHARSPPESLGPRARGGAPILSRVGGAKQRSAAVGLNMSFISWKRQTDREGLLLGDRPPAHTQSGILSLTDGEGRDSQTGVHTFAVPRGCTWEKYGDRSDEVHAVLHRTPSDTRAAAMEAAGGQPLMIPTEVVMHVLRTLSRREGSAPGPDSLTDEVLVHRGVGRRSHSHSRESAAWETTQLRRVGGRACLPPFTKAAGWASPHSAHSGLPRSSSGLP